MTRSIFRSGVRTLRRCLRAARSSAGNATLELSLVLGLFGIPLLLGIYELAILVHEGIEVSNAAHAGAMYGMMSSTYASDTSGITTAAKAEAADFGPVLTVTPTVYYACSQALSGTQYSTQAAASAVCPSGQANHYLEFVKVTTTASLSAPVHIASLPSSLTVNGSSIMEVEE